MDFIEQWFHVSPDNGSGATEVIYVIAGVALVIMLFARRRLAAFVKWCVERVWKNR